MTNLGTSGLHVGGTIGQPWNKMLKAMLEGMIGVNDKPPFPVHL